MFKLFKPNSPLISNEAITLVEELAKEEEHYLPFDVSNFVSGAKIQNAPPHLQRDLALSLIQWLAKNNTPKVNRNVWWRMQGALCYLLKRKLPFSEQDITEILEWAIDEQHNTFHLDLPQIIKLLNKFDSGNSPSEKLRGKIEKLIGIVENHRPTVDDRRRAVRLKNFLGESNTTLPLISGDVWADAAITEIRALDVAKQTAWAELLLHCLRATGSAPSAKWMKETDKFLDVIGRADFFGALLRWFPLADKPRTALVNQYDNGQTLLVGNGDILKGLVWLSAKSNSPDTGRVLTALAVSSYRKIPGVGPRAGKVGNACLWALGNTPCAEGVAQLSLLKVKIKNNTAQKVIANALETAARRAGLTAEEIEEMSVPTYGMEAVGLRSDDFGGVKSEVRVNGSEVEQVWLRKDAKRLAAAPKAVKEKFSEEVKEISQAVKDIRKMLTAQRDRIDNLYLLQKKWKFADWRARYLDHPLVGTIARRLIWKFSKGDAATSAIWFEGQMVGRDGAPIDWLDEATTVELWHPIHVATEIVLEWRQWLVAHEIRQPFKQAYREIYVLTDAERNTHTYSNRYAAHILRQHQFNSLCAARGWKNSLRLLVDAEYPPAMKTLPQWGLRAEYWIEGIGDVYGTDTNETGTYLYLTTDQVRFYRNDALENRAHAGGGGYLTRRLNGVGNAAPIPLEEIPPLAFSEIMRDVDMFVGVASIGNDPNWLDGGAGVRYQDYWHGYSFGELTESAKTRGQVLETLLPRLKIAERCKLSDKFLVVRGDIRTYKIHLGSGNILMEPNDQYLCIVPARGGGMGKDKLFIPFEGDQTLAIILSKAFLLAEDRKIADPTIIRQLKR